MASNTLGADRHLQCRTSLSSFADWNETLLPMLSFVAAMSSWFYQNFQEDMSVTRPADQKPPRLVACGVKPKAQGH
jgi:hypothetical protein